MLARRKLQTGWRYCLCPTDERMIAHLLLRPRVAFGQTSPPCGYPGSWLEFEGNWRRGAYK